MSHSVRRITFGLIIGCAVWAIPTNASAHAGNDDPNAVHACINNASQLVRIVGVGGSCITSPPVRAETAVHWDVRADGPCFNGTSAGGPGGYRYLDCGNGTVTDTVTGLIWLKQWNCLPSAFWIEANQAAAALKDGDCGLTDHSRPGDWRLPTKAEWEATIARAVALGCNPALTNDNGRQCYGDGTGSSFSSFGGLFFWSSTNSDDHPGQSWAVSLGAGGFYNDNGNDHHSFAVWPVRSGAR